MPRNLKFYYNDLVLEIVNAYSYLGIILLSRRVFFKYSNYTCRSSSKGDSKAKCLFLFIDLQKYNQNTHWSYLIS